MKVLSICTGAGLLDRAFLDTGFDVIPGCEIDPVMRRLHKQLCGGAYLCQDLADLPDIVRGQHFAGVIGGPHCQSHSKMRAMRSPKFPDLTPLVLRLLEAVSCDWFVLENVAPIAVPGARHVRLDAMHFYTPPQSRPRWFTFSPGLTPPAALYGGTVDDLMAYPVVMGRVYGPKRGAILQGYPAFADLPSRCADLQLGLANAVPYPLAFGWAVSAAFLYGK